MLIYMRLIFLEAFGLILVSIIDIKSHFYIHAVGYTIWLTSFNFNMLFNCILQHYSGLRTL
uniref:NADH dehydrogenase subunit 4L n=1 Tax=Acrobeloides nanus TaxID=290746 RepID=A0A914D3F4_9BILA